MKSWMIKMYSACFVLLLCTPAIAEVRVVVSIAPLHSLVSGVMQNISEPELLIPSEQSPHNFQLPPSSVRQLYSADLLVWIGPEYEFSIGKHVDDSNEAWRNLTLMESSNLVLYHNRESGNWKKTDQDVTHDEHDEHDESHRHGIQDPHIWLSTENAIQIINQVSKVMSMLDPGNAQTYQGNAESLRNDVSQLHDELANKLGKVKNVPFMVFHDAFQYFEKEFDLNSTGSVTLNPENTPGARRLRELKSVINQEEIVCLFREPQFEPRLIDTLIEGSDVRVEYLDPLGSGIESGREFWFKLMRNLAQSLENCLSG